MSNTLQCDECGVTAKNRGPVTRWFRITFNHHDRADFCSKKCTRAGVKNLVIRKPIFP